MKTYNDYIAEAAEEQREARTNLFNYDTQENGKRLVPENYKEEN